MNYATVEQIVNNQNIGMTAAMDSESVSTQEYANYRMDKSLENM